jgi:hypothetical protein
MMRATGAKLRMLASDARLFCADLDELGGGEADVCGEGDDMTLAAGPPFSQARRNADRPRENREQ